MEKQLFRKASMERIRSPETLDDYLRITTPAVWVVLAAILLVLIGALVWCAFFSVESFAVGTGEVRDGIMTISFDDEARESNIEAGMSVKVGEVSFPVSSVGRTETGRVFALADAPLSDGAYEVSVCYKRTQILKLLFN